MNFNLSEWALKNKGLILYFITWSVKPRGSARGYKRLA